MQDEFLLFLVIGLILMAALLAITNISSTAMSDSYYDRPPILQINDSSEKGRAVGLQGATSSYSETFDFGAGTEERIADLEDKELFAGLLFGENELAYHIEKNLDNVQITFDITKTNGQDNLAVLLDGKVLENRKFDLGTYSISVDNVTAGSVITIRAVNSGWKMWAPTIYGVKNVKITSKSFAQRTFDYTFSISNEYNNFQQGRVELAFTKNIGSMKIYVNGDKVFEGYSEDRNTIYLEKSYLEQGENKITILAEDTSSVEGRANIVIFYEKFVNNEVEIPIQLNQQQLESFRKGIVYFDVKSVQRNGGISVKIINGDEILYQKFVTAEEGRQAFYFTNANVRTGFNRLVIQGVDGAGFKIDNTDVQLR